MSSVRYKHLSCGTAIPRRKHIGLLVVMVICMLAGWSCNNSIAEDGLVLHFPFDVDEPTVITDRSGNGNNGIVHEATFHPEGSIGGAYEFNGAGQYIQVKASPSLQLRDHLSVSVFFYADNYGDQRPLVSWFDPEQFHFGPQVWLHVHGYQWRGLGTGSHLIGSDPHQSPYKRVISFADPPPRQWHHMVVTYDRASGMAQLFINGTRVKEQAVGSYDLFTAGDVMIGAGFIDGTGDPSPYFHGKIDDVRIYNRVLTLPDVAGILRESSIPTIHARDGGYVGARPDADAVLAYDHAAAKKVSAGDPVFARDATGATGAASTGGGGSITTERSRHLVFIGFSNHEHGEEDVTVFYRDELLYVRVFDASLEGLTTNAGVRVMMYQEPLPAFVWDLESSEIPGWFTGNTPLNVFKPGRVYVSVIGWKESGVTLRKEAELFIER